jgi:transcription elongation GreA/GreB family factor
MELNTSVKEKLLARCIELKEESKSNTLAAMNDAQQSANEYGAPKDRYDSFRAQLMRKRDMLAQQLAAVEEELRHLMQMKASNISVKVEAGALVTLESQTLYILAGFGKVILDEKTYYVVSPIVPLVTAMKGLKKGDSFNFRGTGMKILDIC